MEQPKLRVLYGDTDKMGVVYYANYFRYFEFARAEFFRTRGGTYRQMEEQGRMLPVIEATCSYKAPARYDDVLVIRTRVTDVRRVSLTFEYEVHRDTETQVLCTGATVHACVDLQGRLIRLPDELVKLLGR